MIPMEVEEVIDKSTEESEHSPVQSDESSSRKNNSETSATLEKNSKNDSNEQEKATKKNAGKDHGQADNNIDSIKKDIPNKMDLPTSGTSTSENCTKVSDDMEENNSNMTEENRKKSIDGKTGSTTVNISSPIDVDLDEKSNGSPLISTNSDDNTEKHKEEPMDIDSCNEKDKDVMDLSESEDTLDESKLKNSEETSIAVDSDGEFDKTLDVTGERSENEGDVHQEKTEFVQVNSEKDDNEKELLKGDEFLEDPIGNDDVENNIDPMVQGADEELCIIPDTERVLSQEERDAACNSSSQNDVTAEVVDINDDVVAFTITVSKYKDQEPQKCNQCSWSRVPKYAFDQGEKQLYLCNDDCLDALKKSSSSKVILNWENEIRVKDLTPKTDNVVTFKKICGSCEKDIDSTNKSLFWVTMDFCNDACLLKYQKKIGSKCVSCSDLVKLCSLGKYCVKFGNNIHQFCSGNCLENFKKGIKFCSQCQEDINPGNFILIDDKGKSKYVCSQMCLDKYQLIFNEKPPTVDENTSCCVCKQCKPISMSYEHKGVDNYFCSEPCFVAFSFVNNIKSEKCSSCRKNYSLEVLEKNVMFNENTKQSFCSTNCKNIFVMTHRKIMQCAWCRVKKYNFDMITRANPDGSKLYVCSVNCSNMLQVSLTAASSKLTICEYCHKSKHALFHIAMSDASIKSFCTYPCVLAFQENFKKNLNSMDDELFPIPTSTPKRSKRLSKPSDVNPKVTDSSFPVITSVHSLATSNGTQILDKLNTDKDVQIKHHIIFKKPIPDQRNVATQCRPRGNSKGTSTTPDLEDNSTQTDKKEAKKTVIPIPVPTYIPLPMHMFAVPVPIPVPIPIPVPVPIFIPTTRNSANGIMKEIKKIQVKIPTNPYEAELLMIAEMVADDKKEENTDSESDVDEGTGDDNGGGTFSPEPQDGSNTFGDDMLQMALKMATELDEPAVDLEGALTANTITASQTQNDVHHDNTEEISQEQLHLIDRGQRGRKRGMRGSPRGQGGSIPKRGRKSISQHVDMPMMQQPPPPPEPQEKPDANMCLKYTFGVNAWKQWVTFKNAELEKSSRRVKLFKTEILQLTADELNYSLCLFVKEVRKPNGAEYAPDTIYYLCLGIQQYLFENGRIDNIFCDAYYEKFTDCLDEVARRFSVLYNDSHYIVTRVEEEHLWESKQLGAHSPHVLLSTLMFFNTKHFNLTTVDEHMQLSFSHIMKHWKRNPNQAGPAKIPSSRNVLLRFYPPQSAIQNNTRKKKVYEQQENEENPLRCPVKLYEFYLSKCPESVKTRNDVFYLQPERSCVPDSPVWYSTMPLPRDALEKMLHRVKMVKEINVALLTS